MLKLHLDLPEKISSPAAANKILITNLSSTIHRRHERAVNTIRTVVIDSTQVLQTVVIEFLFILQKYFCKYYLYYFSFQFHKQHHYSIGYLLRAFECKRISVLSNLIFNMVDSFEYKSKL